MKAAFIASQAERCMIGPPVFETKKWNENDPPIANRGPHCTGNLFYCGVTSCTHVKLEKYKKSMHISWPQLKFVISYRFMSCDKDIFLKNLMKIPVGNTSLMLNNTNDCLLKVTRLLTVNCDRTRQNFLVKLVWNILFVYANYVYVWKAVLTEKMVNCKRIVIDVHLDLENTQSHREGN